MHSRGGEGRPPGRFFVPKTSKNHRENGVGADLSSPYPELGLGDFNPRKRP